MVKHPYGRFAGLSRPEEQELDLAAGLLSVQGQLAVDLARPLCRLLLHATHRTTHFDEHCVTCYLCTYTCTASNEGTSTLVQPVLTRYVNIQPRWRGPRTRGFVFN